MRQLDSYNIPWVILANAKDLGRTSWISKDGVCGEGPIYRLSEDLEGWMESMDPDAFQEAVRAAKTKPLVAIEFCRLAWRKNPDAARPMMEFLDMCADKARGAAPARPAGG